MEMFELCKRALNKGFVKFTYEKADGTIREAVGTRNISELSTFIDIICKDKEGDSKTANPNICCYFDMVRCAWRSFNADRLISIQYTNLTYTEVMCFAMSLAIKDSESPITDIVTIAQKFVGDADVLKITNFVCSHMEVENLGELTLATLYNDTLEQAKDEEPTVVVEQPALDRKALIAELVELQKRQSEIMALLLA